MMAIQRLWDWGTAYDLFVNLAVLHDPATLGLRRRIRPGCGRCTI
jgi:hypothetical protein